MPKINKFDNFIYKQFCNKYSLTDLSQLKLLKQQNVWNFRYTCFKYNYFMKCIMLSNIQKHSMYEAVLIEFRTFPHIEFIIRNAIYKLGSEWSFTVICGNKNYDLVNYICESISPNIKIIKLNYNNMTQKEYSDYLTTTEFWNLLNGEKILIYQEDSIIFKHNINDFIEYDYIGAPFPKNTDDTPNGVGNGGLSFRSKCKMIEVIEKYPLSKFKPEHSTQQYMKFKGLTNAPEDVYFSNNMQTHSIGDVANWDAAYDFSSETVFNPNSFGGHQFWISNENWKKHLSRKFNFKQYTAKSDLNKYLKIAKLPLHFNNTLKIPNAFDIDLYFFCKVNNIEYTTDYEALQFLTKIGLYGFLYHPKQLLNLFNNIQLYKFLNNMFVFYNEQMFTVQDFANKYVYNSSFEFINELSLIKKYECLNNNYQILLLVFIGNEEIGCDLINRIIKYKQKHQQDINVAFCINNNVNTKVLKKIIKKNFDFYAVYYSKEFGTDIIPTLLMYNNIMKKYNFKHIIKLHTKRVSHLYNDLTNFLLSKPLNELLANKLNDCNCIGPEQCYLNLTSDKFNIKQKQLYRSKLNINFKFVAGTIFYCENIVMNKVLTFIKKNNYKLYLLNNLYENNAINYEFSPIHFIERLFGTIKL